MSEETKRKRGSIEHVGIHVGRCDRNPEERGLSAAWAKMNKESRILSYILGSGNQAVPITQRDATVAATVVQWLGSPVGKSLLDAARKEAP